MSAGRWRVFQFARGGGGEASWVAGRTRCRMDEVKEFRTWREFPSWREAYTYADKQARR